MKQFHKPLTSRPAGLAAVLLAAGLLGSFPQSGQAGEGGAFVGGLIGGHVLTKMVDNSERQARAAEHQAYRQPAPAAAPAQAPASSQQSVEERLATLDKLAANGIITKEEYQARRQGILDDL